MKARRIVLIAVAALVALSVAGIASAQQTQLEQRGRGPLGDGPRGPGRRPVAAFAGRIVDAVSEATGLTPSEIVQELADGKTLNTILEEHGASSDAIKAEHLAQMSERLTAAVENGRIDQERADEMLAAAAARLDELFDRVFERLTEPAFPGGRRGPRNPNWI